MWSLAQEDTACEHSSLSLWLSPAPLREMLATFCGRDLPLALLSCILWVWRVSEPLKLEGLFLASAESRGSESQPGILTPNCRVCLLTLEGVKEVGEARSERRWVVAFCLKIPKPPDAHSFSQYAMG